MEDKNEYLIHYIDEFRVSEFGYTERDLDDYYGDFTGYTNCGYVIDDEVLEIEVYDIFQAEGKKEVKEYVYKNYPCEVFTIHKLGKAITEEDL
jgi:hypothetical protein